MERCRIVAVVRNNLWLGFSRCGSQAGELFPWLVPYKSGKFNKSIIVGWMYRTRWKVKSCFHRRCVHVFVGWRFCWYFPWLFWPEKNTFAVMVSVYIVQWLRKSSLISIGLYACGRYVKASCRRVYNIYVLYRLNNCIDFWTSLCNSLYTKPSLVLSDISQNKTLEAYLSYVYTYRSLGLELEIRL